MATSKEGTMSTETTVNDDLLVRAIVVLERLDDDPKATYEDMAREVLELRETPRCEGCGSSVVSGPFPPDAVYLCAGCTNA